MSQYTFEDYEKKQSQSTNKTTDKPKFSVSFFKLDEGETAIVRFYGCDTKKDVILNKTHKVLVDKSKNLWKSIKCLRESVDDPVTTCPFCDNETKIQWTVELKLLKYTTDENGKIKVEPCVWERPSAFFKENIASYMEDYVLSDTLFKIKRTGTGKETRYSIIPAQTAVYKNEMYPKDFSAFDDYKYHIYLDKTYDEIEYFFENNKFPEKKSENFAETVKVPAKSTTEVLQEQMKGTGVSLDEALKPEESVARTAQTGAVSRTSEDAPATPRRTYQY